MIALMVLINVWLFLIYMAIRRLVFNQHQSDLNDNDRANDIIMAIRKANQS